LDALADLSELSFTLAIIGEGGERKKLEELIKERHLEKKVFLTGFKENATSYLKAFDLFTFPSLSEGLGYTLLEAGLASLPVIASRTGGIPEVIENLKDGLLVAPGRSNEIRQAFIYLDEHPDDVRSFGQNLEKKVKENFSLKEMVKKTEEIYEH
jgi:glycosyltransferase involved in cell wall biosynthesis